MPLPNCTAQGMTRTITRWRDDGRQDPVAALPGRNR
ncbi:hypothetical protein FHS61_001379 [Altererythrobacter atlanticus]|nr:hypothetical protein [Croceibacterium atlanticum]